MTHQFLSAWRAFEESNPPLVLPGDEVVLSPLNRSGWTKCIRLDAYVSSPAFGDPRDRSLHLGLCPIPFVGKPSKARVFVLMLNPGLSPGDYFAEQHSKFRAAVWANLKGESDFLYLDPRYGWHPGFDYWHGKLTSVIQGVARRTNVTYQQALRRAAANTCVIQLVPYHSISFGLTEGVVRGMRSPRLAKQFVHDHVLPRVRRGDALLIVTRQKQRWDIAPDSGAVIYEGSETRSAHLTEASRGGAKILDFLATGPPNKTIEPTQKKRGSSLSRYAH